MGKAALSVLHFCHGKEAVVAVEILILTVLGQLLLDLVIPAHSDAVRNHGDVPCPFFHAMGEKHLLGASVPHLHWMHINVFFVGIYVQKQLRGVPNPCHGIKRMPPSDQRKIGDRVQFKQIRAGHLEEIPHHQIRIPYGLKLG